MVLAIISFFFSTLFFILDFSACVVLNILKGDSWLPRDLRQKQKVVGVTVEDENKKDNETKPYRNVKVAKTELMDTPIKGVYTVHGLFKKASEKYKKQRCLGSRDLIKIEETVQNDKKIFTYEYDSAELKWNTYEEVDKKIANIASGIVQVTGLNSNDKFGMYANTCKEWLMTAQACMRYNITLVSVYASLGEEALVHCLNECKITTLFTEEALLSKIEKVASKVPTLKCVIYVKTNSKSDESAAKKAEGSTKIKIVSINEIERIGASASKDIPVKEEATKESLMLIMYTSGTTGIPKGVMITHGAVCAAIAGVDNTLELDYSESQTYFAYLPLAHILEFVAEHFMICNGCSIGYGTVKTLSSLTTKPCGDLEAVKPTLLAGVPRVFETIRKGICEMIEGPKTSSIVRWLFKTAFEQKKSALYAGRDTPFWNLLVFNKISQRIGGKVRVIASGGAALGKETQEFLRVVFNASICQGYGLTETNAALSVQCSRHPFRVRCTGAPVTCAEVKLVSVPDMGYTVDDPQGPKGEICVRGPALSSGYYLNPEKTKEDFTDDGYFHTGDIGAIDEYGILSIIDRKKNLVKLDHGEYVALERLETVYGNSSLVSPNGICCYGDSSVRFVVALILPQPAAIKRIAELKGIKYANLKELYQNEKVKEEVMKSLKEEAKKGNLQRIERVEKITLLDDEWTPDNECLTAAMKLKRNIIAKRYQKEIDTMYGR